MAFNLGDIFVTFKAKTDDLQAGVAKVKSMTAATESAVNKIGFKEFASNASTAFGGVASSISSVVTKLAVVAGASAYGGSKFISLAGDLQTTQARMAALAGSTEAAAKIMGELYTYTLGKPIAFPEASKAAQTLMGYGVATKDVIASMKTLSAFSIVNGSDMSQLALAYGQVNAKGKLMGQEIIQLVNNFVPVSQVIAKHFNVSVEKAMELMEGGAISAADFNAAMANFIPQEKIAEQSNTFKNRLISLQGAIRSFGLSLIGVRVDEKLGLVVESGGLFDRLSNFLPVLSAKLKELKPIISGAFQWIVDHGETVKNLVLAIGAAFVVAKTAAVGMAIVSALANPFNLIAYAVTALVFGLTYLQLKFDWIGKVVSFLRPVLNIISGVFGDLWESVGKLAGVLGKELAPVFEFVGRNAEVFKKILLIIGAAVFAPLVLAIGSIIAGLKILAIIIGFVADHFQGIKQAVMIVLAIAFAPLIAIIALAIGAFIAIREAVGFAINVFQWLVATVQSVGSTIASVFAAIWGTIYNTIMAVWAFLAPILDFIKNLFIIVFGSILIVILTIMEGIKAVVFAVWNVIYGFVSGVLGAVSGVIVGAFNFMLGIVTSVMSAIFGFISGIWGAIYGVFTSVVGAIVGFFSGAFNWLLGAGQAIVRGLIHGLQMMIGGVGGAIKSVGDPIGAFFGSAGMWLVNAGKAIVQGLINGLKSMVGAVGNAAAEIGNTVKSKITGLFGIHSPSKLFTGYGRNLMEGMANGIRNAQSLVADALTTMTDVAVNPVITPALNDVAGSLSTGGGIGVAAAAAGSLSNSTNIYGNINIGSENDADYLLTRLDRNATLVSRGGTPI